MRQQKAMTMTIEVQNSTYCKILTQVPLITILFYTVGVDLEVGVPVNAGCLLRIRREPQPHVPVSLLLARGILKLPVKKMYENILSMCLAVQQLIVQTVLIYTPVSMEGC